MRACNYDEEATATMVNVIIQHYQVDVQPLTLAITTRLLR